MTVRDASILTSPIEFVDDLFVNKIMAGDINVKVISTQYQQDDETAKVQLQYTHLLNREYV